jgi:hypothetical protein
MSKKFYETDEFKKQNTFWKKELYESGFDDIETAGEDGPLRNDAADNFEVFAPAPDILDQCSQESVDVSDAVSSIHDRARGALDSPAVWAGLPPAARRWWALVVLAGWSDERAKWHVGIRSNDVTTKWRKTILARL